MDVIDSKPLMEHTDIDIHYTRHRREFPMFPTLPRRSTTNTFDSSNLLSSTPPQTQYPTGELDVSTALVSIGQTSYEDREPECKKKVEAEEIPEKYDQKETEQSLQYFLDCYNKVVKWEQEQGRKKQIT